MNTCYGHFQRYVSNMVVVSSVHRGNRVPREINRSVTSHKLQTHRHEREMILIGDRLLIVVRVDVNLSTIEIAVTKVPKSLNRSIFSQGLQYGFTSSKIT